MPSSDDYRSGQKSLGKLGFGTLLSVGAKAGLGGAGAFGAVADLTINIVAGFAGTWCKDVLHQMTRGGRELNHHLEFAFGRALARAGCSGVEVVRHRLGDRWDSTADRGWAEELARDCNRWLKATPPDLHAHPLAILAANTDSSTVSEFTEFLREPESVRALARKLELGVFRAQHVASIGPPIAAAIAECLHVLIWDELKRDQAAWVAYDGAIKQAQNAMMRQILEGQAVQRRLLEAGQSEWRAIAAQLQLLADQDASARRSQFEARLADALRFLDTDLRAAIDRIEDSVARLEQVTDRVDASVNRVERMVSLALSHVFEATGAKAASPVATPRRPVMARRDEDVNPFKGLEAYHEEDEPVFFGRDSWLEDALTEFEHAWSPTGAPFFGIVGGSGSGKSSLLRAGMIARLNRPGTPRLHFATTLTAAELAPSGGSDSRSFADSVLGRIFFRALASVGADSDRTRDFDRGVTRIVANRPRWTVSALIEALDRIAAGKGETEGKARLVVGLDQFEELLDLRGAASTTAALAPLFQFFTLACASGRIGFIYTCQSNRRQLLRDDEVLKSLVSDAQEKAVPFLSEECIKEIAIRKFAHAGMDVREVVGDLYRRVHAFTEDRILVENASDGLRDVQATLLPLVSVTLLQLYEHCRGLRDKLRQERVRRTAAPVAIGKAGGLPETCLSAEGELKVSRRDVPDALLEVDTAISALADRAMNEVRSAPGVRWTDEVLDTLLRGLVRVHDAQQHRYSLPALSIPLRGPRRVFVEVFRKYRLLIPVQRDQVRLVHEALVTNWPPARERVAKDEELHRAVGEILPFVKRWNESKRRPELAGARLDDEQRETLGRLLVAWSDLFLPGDAAAPRPEDLLLREFAFAALEAALTPSRRAKWRDVDTTHFLLAVFYGQTALAEKYLLVEPGAARDHRTAKRSNAAMMAAHNGDEAVLDLVLRHGADPVAVNDEKSQPLHFAAFRGHIAAFDRLVAAGADPHAVGIAHSTALHFAASASQFEMLRHLVRVHGADPNVCDESGWTPLMLAARFAAPELAIWLLEGDRVRPHPVDDQTWPPFLTACRHGTAAMVRAFLKHPATDPLRKNKDGWTALHLGIASRSAEIVRALLEDLRIDAVAVTPRGKTPVEMAVHEGDAAVLAELLNDPHGRIDPDHGADKTQSPLGQACAAGKAELVRLLLDAGAKPNRSEKRRSPFLDAVQRDDIRMLRLLLAHADVTERNELGQTALHLAAGENAVASVELLAERVDCHVADLSGTSALHAAVAAGSHRAVHALLQRFPDLIEAADAFGRKALHIAAARGDRMLVEDLIGTWGAAARDAGGMTALHHAARKGQHEVAALLLRHPESDINAEDDAGWTPLHHAAQDGNAETIAMLLKAGARIGTAAARPARTAFELAAAAGRADLIGLLLPEQLAAADRRRMASAAALLAVRNAQFATALAALNLAEATAS